MKLLFPVLVSSLLCVWSSSVAAARQCFFEQTVTQVATGYVTAGQVGGPDGGDAVVFNLSNGTWYQLNNYFNLDLPRGQALHRTLLAAMAQRYRVTGYDHYTPFCDDIDEIVVRP